MCRLRLMKGRCLLLVLLPLILLAACDDGARQRLQLEELERMNRADSLMTNDSLALDLAEWFDDHGTPNEQLRAHYILGRTYADLSEAPQAIEAYNDAADRADTTDADCDYYTLCRVYSQMAVIFYQQNLFNDNLRCLDLSITYAYKANDTIAALNSYGQKTDVFDQLDYPDSVIATCQKLISQPAIYNDFMAMMCNAYIKKGNLNEARRCLDIYERQSGYFDSLGNIEKGREAYYNIKGKYFFAKEQLDSAEYYFRKEFREGHEYIFQEMSARFLSLLYQRKGLCDSTSKYALYSYEMNDSSFYQTSSRTVARIQAMYDYSRHQRIAQQEKERADSERMRLWLLLAVIAVSSIVITIIIHRIRRSRKEVYAAYNAKIIELEKVQTDVLRLRSNEAELNSLIHEKESQMKQLNKEMSFLRKNSYKSGDETEFRLSSSPVYQELQKKANQGIVLTDSDWSQLSRLVIELLPDFHQFILSEQFRLGINEYRTLILLRLHIKPKPISYLLGCTPQNITKIGKVTLQKLFNVDGTCSDLSNLILKMH